MVNNGNHPILNVLFDDTSDLLEVIHAYDIYPYITDLGSEVNALVYRCRMDHYHVIINCNLSPKSQQELLIHEVRHILKHMPETGYIIGLDMERHEIELDADLFVREVTTSYCKRDCL